MKQALTLSTRFLPHPTPICALAVCQYHAKPVLTRPQHVFFKGPNYFEIDVDVHLFAYISKKFLHSLLDSFGDMVLDVGFLIEAHTDEELPEVMLGCMRWSRVDLECAPPFPE